jgi:hypothetical protein
VFHRRTRKSASKNQIEIRRQKFPASNRKKTALQKIFNKAS